MEFNAHPLSAFKWLLTLFLLSLLCMGTFVVITDQICGSNIEEWVPLYPGATTVSSKYNFIRPRGMGVSRVVLSTTDDPETARQFYRDTTIRLMRAGETRGLATTDWRVYPDPNGSGSLITLYSECAQ